MKIETKFNMNQTVWHIDRKYVWEEHDCYTCNNTGHVTIKKKEFTCPNCRGLGNKNTRYITHVPIKNKICSIDISIDDDGKEIEYQVGADMYDSVYLEECEVYTSEKQAQKVCNKLNAEDNKK